MYNQIVQKTCCLCSCHIRMACEHKGEETIVVTGAVSLLFGCDKLCDGYAIIETNYTVVVTNKLAV